MSLFRRDPDRCPHRRCRLLRGLCADHYQETSR